MLHWYFAKLYWANWCVTRWLDYLLNFCLLLQRKIAQWNKNCQSHFKILPNLNNPWKNCPRLLKLEKVAKNSSLVTLLHIFLIGLDKRENMILTLKLFSPLANHRPTWRRNLRTLQHHYFRISWSHFCSSWCHLRRSPHQDESRGTWDLGSSQGRAGSSQTEVRTMGRHWQHRN